MAKKTSSKQKKVTSKKGASAFEKNLHPAAIITAVVFGLVAISAYAVAQPNSSFGLVADAQDSGSSSSSDNASGSDSRSSSDSTSLSSDDQPSSSSDAVSIDSPSVDDMSQATLTRTQNNFRVVRSLDEVSSSSDSLSNSDSISPSDDTLSEDSLSLERNEVEIEIEEELERANGALVSQKVKIKTTNFGSYLVEGGVTKSLISVPVVFSEESNQLLLETENGFQQLTVLPEEAASALLTFNENVTIQPVATGDQEENVVTNTLDLVNGQPVYSFRVTEQQRLLGLFPVSIDRQYQVSATNEGEEPQLVSSGFFSRLLDLISF